MNHFVKNVTIALFKNVYADSQIFFIFGMSTRFEIVKQIFVEDFTDFIDPLFDFVFIKLFA